jgi:hypothetical protein
VGEKKPDPTVHGQGGIIFSKGILPSPPVIPSRRQHL